MKHYLISLLLFFISTNLINLQAQDNTTDTSTSINQLEQLAHFFSKHHIAAEKTNGIAQVDTLLQLLSQHNKFMGSVSIVKNGKLLYSKAFGYALLNDSIALPATRQTKYRLGAISELYTTVLVTELCSKNKLDGYLWLDDISLKIKNAAIITVHDLMNHQSGIPCFTQDSLYKTYYTQAKTTKEMIDIISTYPSNFAPRSNTEFSHSNYLLLGVALKKATRKGYNKNLQEIICQKLNLSNTYYAETINYKLNEAHSYTYYLNKWKHKTPSHLSIYGAGGAVVASSDDLALFMNNLLRGKLIPIGCVASTILKNKDNPNAVGFVGINYDKKPGWGYTSHIDDFYASANYFPDDSLSIAICSNGLNYSLSNLTNNILDIIYQEKYQLPDIATSHQVNNDKLKLYEGEYRHSDYPNKVNIQAIDQQLTLQATGQERFSLEALSDHKFKNDLNNISITFLPKQNALILVQGKGSLKLKKQIRP